MKLEVNKALERGLSLPYALVRSLSEVTLGPAPASVDLDELLEVRFFSEQEEIRIFQGEEGLQAVRLPDVEGGAALPVTCKLMNPIFGCEITLCREVAFDEDGQAYVSGLRLTGWEGGEG